MFEVHQVNYHPELGEDVGEVQKSFAELGWSVWVSRVVEKVWVGTRIISTYLGVTPELFR